MEPTVADLAKSIADTQTALNIVWTMVAAFLVMFMQAGFALVETGLTRAKNVAHTMGMNFFVYAIGILGFYFVGFGLQMGSFGPMATFGGDATLSSPMFAIDLLGKPFELFGTSGFMLPPSMFTPAVCFSTRPVRVIRQSSTRQSAGKLLVRGPGVRSKSSSRFTWL